MCLPKGWGVDLHEDNAALGFGEHAQRPVCLPHLLHPDFGFQVSGFGFRVSGFGFRVSGFGFWVSGFGIRVSGFGFRVSGLGFRVSGLGFRVSGFGFRVSGVMTKRRVAFRKSPLRVLQKVLVGDDPPSACLQRACRGTSLIRFRANLGPYSSPMPTDLWS